MKRSITVYVENEDQLTKLKAVLLTLDLSFKETEKVCKEPDKSNEV